MIHFVQNDTVLRALVLVEPVQKHVWDGLTAVENDFTIHGPVRGGPSNALVGTTLVGALNDPVDTQYPFDVVDSSALPTYAKNFDAVPFYTNEPVDDVIGLDRRRTMRRAARYLMRRGIETSYRNSRGSCLQRRPRTSVSDFPLRARGPHVQDVVAGGLSCQVLDEEGVGAFC